MFGERGQYWLDPALLMEYGHAMLAGVPDEMKFGPLLRKEIGPTINTVNLFLDKELGQFAGTGRMNFSYAWETRIATGWVIEPGFQAYGEPGPLGHFASISAQDHRIGPQFFGAIHDFGPGTLKSNGGILFGLPPGRRGRPCAGSRNTKSTSSRARKATGLNHELPGIYPAF